MSASTVYSSASLVYAGSSATSDVSGPAASFAYSLPFMSDVATTRGSEKTEDTFMDQYTAQAIAAQALLQLAGPTHPDEHTSPFTPRAPH